MATSEIAKPKEEGLVADLVAAVRAVADLTPDRREASAVDAKFAERALAVATEALEEERRRATRYERALARERKARAADREIARCSAKQAAAVRAELEQELARCRWVLAKRRALAKALGSSAPGLILSGYFLLEENYAASLTAFIGYSTALGTLLTILMWLRHRRG
jgi:hypothetical protein